MYPSNVVAYPDGNSFVVTDQANHVLRRVTKAGKVTTLAGIPSRKRDVDGDGSKAQFNRPTGLALCQDGSILVCDSRNHKLRRVMVSGTGTVTVSTFAGWRGRLCERIGE